jgi:PAS domain S-box-containing protein
MPIAQDDLSTDQPRPMKVERSDETRAAGILRSKLGENGVRIATLSRIFVVVLVFMTFAIVGITLFNVGEGQEVVDHWRAIEQQNIARHSVARRLDLAELINSFQVFQGRPDKVTAQAVLSNIEDFETSIDAYKSLTGDYAEKQVLMTIGRALDNYRRAVAILPDPGSGRFDGINKNLKIVADTYDAIIAVKQLKAEYDYQRDDSFFRMGTSVEAMMSILNLIAVTSSFMVAAIGALIWWLSNRMLIRPLEALRQNMINLAKGDASVAMQSDQMLLDIREMATSVEVFRRNLIDADRLRREDKTAQRRIKILSQAIDQSPASMVLIDLEKHIQYFNPQFCQVLGYAPDDLIGQDFKVVLDPHLADDLTSDLADDLEDRIWSAVSETDSWNGEIQTRSRNGEKQWQHIVVSPVRDGDEDVSYYLVVMEDISRQKEFEARLIDAKETAELAYRSKTEFLANMTHELRTPLNAIIGFSEIIKSEMLGPIEQPHYLEYSNDIFESGNHLLGLIENILDFSKFEAGKQELVEGKFDLAPTFLLSRNFAGERARLQNIDIHLELPSAPLKILADERKIKQILLNLISNAVKFSHEGGEVTAGFRLGPDGKVLMFVQDHGIGISEENIATALAPFGQVDSKLSRTYEGTGLGLPLSRAVAEAHGGSLTIDSELGVGTTVIVSLPKERNLQFAYSENSDCEISDCA